MRESPLKTEEEFAEDGQYVPNETDPLRWLRIGWEALRGFRFLKKYRLAATFFGTARCSFDDGVYKDARDLASRLSKSGFAIITGGGPGIMQAANQGANDAGGTSIGLAIELPNEQGVNKYVTDSLSFHYFFIRKVMLAFASEVYIYFPGGFGTMDELFEILTLIQTKKIQKIPVVLVGAEYWAPLLEWINDTLYEKGGAINMEDMGLYYLADSVDEAYEHIMRSIPGKKREQER